MLGNGFIGQLDVGRYLAGDYGGDVVMDREFKQRVQGGGISR